VAAQHRSRRVPAVGVGVFALAVAAGLCAVVSLLIDLGSGVSGFYSNGWVVAFFASFGAMIVLFSLSIGIGAAALSHRGLVDGLNRSRLLVAALELVAIAGLVTAVHYDVGGYGVPLLADLLVLVFAGGLVRWNLWIWRRLIA
jgi:hypothetical protein